MKVRWTEAGAANWEKAFDYVAPDNLAPALTIAEKIIEMTEMLTVHPQAGRLGRIANMRELVIPNYPFNRKVRSRRSCAAISSRASTLSISMRKLMVFCSLTAR